MSMEMAIETRETTFDKATPMGRPHRHGQAGLFVPIPGFENDLPPTLKNGAAIVGFGNPNGTLTIYFESNRFDDSSLHKWEDKAQLAFRRMIDHLPTTNKSVVPPSQMEQVGIMEADGLRLTRFESLKRWLHHSQALDTIPHTTELNWR
jgi:hypothetical protein